ncbi:hypothetical protein [Streptomyces sp. NRRL S-455]|uniref:hypothetical protein n=1 Tax=Streptomyces sp. NRRL S-455 TaxID=1463908 RepID=UPI0004C0F371|nr:hypothetical protein [Streptomyces sp. NRRL S-455]
MTTMTDPFSADAVKAVRFLSGEKKVGAKFPKVGHVVAGTITDWRMAQQTDNETRELLFWQGKKPTPQSQLTIPTESARPVEMMVIELQCEPTGVTWEGKDYEEVQLPEDDGKRTLYVSNTKIKALADALKQAGMQLPEVGGYLEMARGKSVKAPGAKFPSQSFTARYTPADKNTRREQDLPVHTSTSVSEDGEAADPFGG